ncbi:hypothetical protein F5888DRAFT_511779 [Russula emetica]|nr:hypothetical protein F5888DRAFT_511779 [Russula emetica]
MIERKFGIPLQLGVTVAACVPYFLLHSEFYPREFRSNWYWEVHTVTVIARGVVKKCSRASDGYYSRGENHHTSLFPPLSRKSPRSIQHSLSKAVFRMNAALAVRFLSDTFSVLPWPRSPSWGWDEDRFEFGNSWPARIYSSTSHMSCLPSRESEKSCI